MRENKLLTFLLGAALVIGCRSNCPGTLEDRRAVIQAAFENQVGKMEELLARNRTLANLEACTPANPVASLISGGAPPAPLKIAARQGHTDIARILLAHGAGVDPPDYHGVGTPLHQAAQYGHDGVASLLISHGAKLEARTTAGLTPLHLAAWHGRFVVVKQLLAAGAQVDARSGFKWTPLHWAASNGHADVVRLLLAHGADALATADGGLTPLSLAQQDHHQEVIALLSAPPLENPARR